MIDNQVFNNFDEADAKAKEVTESTGEEHIAATYGMNDYTIFRMPQIGDEVSYAFNGDYRPCGTIVKITPTKRITTSTGMTFSRISDTKWKQGGKKGTWSMVRGHIDERNPHF